VHLGVGHRLGRARDDLVDLAVDANLVLDALVSVGAVGATVSLLADVVAATVLLGADTLPESSTPRTAIW
jgi:hypothetical protein